MSAYKHIGQTGFSLIELVVVIILLGIVSVVVIPGVNISTFEERGFLQQSLATIRYGQKSAVASGCYVRVQISPTICQLSWTGAPAGTNCPASGVSLRNPANNNVNFCAGTAAAGSPSANFVYDNIGVPGGTQVINFGNGTIRVESETGYAHEI